MKKERIHYTSNWIVNPTQPLTIFLIGAGGTGSNMLSALAIINKSLIALGHPGIFVTVFDDDKVEEPNIARQLFYASDLGLFKAQVLVERINRAFGYAWRYETERYTSNNKTANITISCVDSVESRKAIAEAVHNNSRGTDHERQYYWMDCGNDITSGQIYLGTTLDITQPKSKMKVIKFLKSPIEYFKGLKDSKDDGPSCSLAGALSKQDLFINRTIANYAGHMLWTLIKDARINYQGIYINLQSLQTNPIPL